MECGKALPRRAVTEGNSGWAMRSATLPRGEAHLYDHRITMSIGTAPPTPAAPGHARLTAERLSDRLAARLASHIESALKPGDRLPTENQIALAHGVSRTVVREAVHQLQSRGLVRSRQGAGVFVLDPQRALPQFDRSVLESLDAVQQMVEVRRVLEGEMAALAAERATREQTRALKRALAAIDTATADGRDGLDEDLAFHRAIGEATGNAQFRTLLSFLERYLREAMRVTRGNESRRDDFMQQVRTEHHAIVDAIASGNPAAARRAAVEHLVHAEWRLREGGVLPRVTRRAKNATPPTKRTRR